MANGYGRNQRVFVQTESTYGVVPGASTPTLGNGDAMRIISCNIKPDVRTLVRRDKTGNRSQARGVVGEKRASWEMSWSGVPGSGAGVVPNANPIYRSIFGQAPTVTPGVSVVYDILPSDDAIQSFTLWNFRSPVALNQEVAAGCFVDTVRIGLGTDLHEISASGPALWLNTKEQMLTLPDGDKGKFGMTGTTLPAEPAAPVYAGNAIQSFYGSILVDGQTISEFEGGEISLALGARLRRVFGQGYATVPILGLRAVSITMQVTDSELAALANMRAKGLSKSAVDIVATVGTVVGERFEYTIRGVQLAYPDTAENDELFTASFGSSQATIAAGSSTPNEFSMKIF